MPYEKEEDEVNSELIQDDNVGLKLLMKSSENTLISSRERTSKVGEDQSQVGSAILN